MIETALPPGLILIASGLLTLVLPRGARGAALLLAPLLTLFTAWYLSGFAAPAPEGSAFSGTLYLTGANWLGMELHPVRIDALGLLFTTVFAITAFAGGLFALRLPDAKELAALQVYAGSAVGAVLAGDVVTLFVFWELMAIASTIIIWAGGAGAKGAGLRYAAIHFLGGAFLMAGIAGQVVTTGETAFTALPDGGIIPALVLVAFLINAGAWPLNAWLPDAYPRASWAGTVFLSAFTTKTAVYALVRGFPGEEWLIWLGMATMLYGIVYALIETELRRLLCYAIIAQTGFMLVGTGIGTPMALDGAAGHAFVSILYSALLFMAAGAILRQTGTVEAERLGGLWRAMPLTAGLAVIGAVCISAFPGTGAFVSKSLISSGAGKAEMLWVWLGLTAAGVGVVLHGGVRFPLLAFFQDRPGPRLTDPPLPMQAAMVIVAALVLAIAPAWQVFYALLPGTPDYMPYKASGVLAQFQLLVFGAIAYLAAWRLLPVRAGTTLDTDWLYRGAGRAVARVGGEGLLALYARAEAWTVDRYIRVIDSLYSMHGPGGALARSRPSGYMALWMTVMLLLLLVFTVV